MHMASRSPSCSGVVASMWSRLKDHLVSESDLRGSHGNILISMDKILAQVVKYPGGLVDVEVERGLSVREVLELVGIVQLGSETQVRVNSVVVSKLELASTEYLGGTILVTEPIIGHAPTPSVADAVWLLHHSGYSADRGKGDHKKFVHPTMGSLQLNPDKRDSKVLDLPSSKAMAKVFGLSLADLTRVARARDDSALKIEP